MDKQLEPLAGHLHMLILKAVLLGPCSATAFCCGFKRFRKIVWITTEWEESENKRKAKYYRLTAADKRKLPTETEKWNRMADINAILHTTPGEV